MKKVFILMLSMYTMIGCTFTTSNYDDSVDNNAKKAIDKLNSEIITGIENNQPEIILSHSSEKLVALAKNDIMSLVHQTSILLKSENFKIIKQFQITNSSDNVITSTNSDSAKGHEYNIVFKPITKESFITVGEFQDSLHTFAFTTIFGKYANDWKLNMIKIGEIKFLNMDAIDWYKQSKIDYQKGDFVDAANKYKFATQLLKPAGEYWFYKNENEINDYGKTLINSINKTFTFPIPIEINSRKIFIFRTQPQLLASSYYPSISYVTTIDLNDTVALSKECDKLNENIGKIFYGIDKNNIKIHYSVFQKIPVSNNEKNFSFLKPIK